MKIILLGIILSLCMLVPNPVFPQAEDDAEPYWLVLERGKRLFRDGSYGEALLAFEDAKRQRKQLFTSLEGYLIDLLSVPEVRLFGKSLDMVEEYIATGNQPNARKALDELFYRYNRDGLNNSSDEALEKLDKLKGYPEAEYWIGESYRIEGEYGVALSQYARAYELRDLLETPDFAWDLLYKMAELHRLRGEYHAMETRLREILADDPLWNEDDRTFIRSAMSKTLSQDGADGFLKLYRYDNYNVEKAHRLLGIYYYSTGRYERALEHLAFSFLIQNTLLLNELRDRDFDFSFSSYALLLDLIKKDIPFVQYLRDVEYYKMVYYLGAGLYALGNKAKAEELWKLLAHNTEAGEWRGRAAIQLRKPFIEEITIYP